MLMLSSEPVKTDLRGYNLAVIYNHDFMNFARLFVGSLIDNNIKFHNIYIGDAGLTDEDVSWFLSIFSDRMVLVDLPWKESQGVKHQSPEYRKILDNRPFFWYHMSKLGSPFVHLDGDTAIISNDFSLLDFNADMTITVHEASPATQTDRKPDREYVNCGVTFYHKPERCGDVLSTYHAFMVDMYKSKEYKLIHQYDQPAYYRAVKMAREYALCRIQNVHGMYYNCWEKHEINARTSILHFKNNRFNMTFEDRVNRLIELPKGETT